MSFSGSSGDPARGLRSAASEATYSAHKKQRHGHPPRLTPHDTTPLVLNGSAGSQTQLLRGRRRLCGHASGSSVARFMSTPMRKHDGFCLMGTAPRCRRAPRTGLMQSTIL